MLAGSVSYQECHVRIEPSRYYYGPVCEVCHTFIPIALGAVDERTQPRRLTGAATKAHCPHCREVMWCAPSSYVRRLSDPDGQFTLG